MHYQIRKQFVCMCYYQYYNGCKRGAQKLAGLQSAPKSAVLLYLEDPVLELFKHAPRKSPPSPMNSPHQWTFSSLASLHSVEYTTIRTEMVTNDNWRSFIRFRCRNAKANVFPHILFRICFCYESASQNSRPHLRKHTESQR